MKALNLSRILVFLIINPSVSLLIIFFRSDCVALGRAVAEGLRSWLRYLPLHRHQHLRDHRVEGVQPRHRQHWTWNRVRGSHHCPVPPARHQTGQGEPKLLFLFFSG